MYEGSSHPKVRFVDDVRTITFVECAYQHSHIKLREVASRVVETGELPPTARLAADEKG